MCLSGYCLGKEDLTRKKKNMGKRKESRKLMMGCGIPLGKRRMLRKDSLIVQGKTVNKIETGSRIKSMCQGDNLGVRFLEEKQTER